jgi:tRNA(Glu) U13 pseudouridine synthase TruD
MLEADGLWELLGPQQQQQQAGGVPPSGMKNSDRDDAVVSVRGAYRPLLVRTSKYMERASMGPGPILRVMLLLKSPHTHTHTHIIPSPPEPKPDPQTRPQKLEWAFLPPQRPPTNNDDGHDDDQGLDLDLSFELEAGAFATVLLREVLGREPQTYTPPPPAWTSPNGGGGEEEEGGTGEEAEENGV